MTTTYIHTFCMLRLREKGISLTGIANVIECTPQLVSQVLLGKDRSERVQYTIARILSYPSWYDLDKAAQAFSAILPDIYNSPKPANVKPPMQRREENVG